MKLLIFKICFLSFFVWIIISIARQWPDDYVHIIFCDVGQGDAILITHDNRQMLVDGGPDEKVLSCLENHMPFWDKSIDFLVITHMDQDHIGGLPSVLSRYMVDNVIKNLSSKKTADFETLKDVVSTKSIKNTKKFVPHINQQLFLSDLVRSIVISPQVNYVPIRTINTSKTETILSDKNINFRPVFKNNISENDLSIGLFVMIGDIQLLLTGDMEKQGELAVIDRGMTRPVDIIKAGHHGSKSSSSRQFIDVFKPEVAVISSGKNNQYNHPSPRVIDLFHEFGVDIYRTDSQGTIEFITDGVKYWGPI